MRKYALLAVLAVLISALQSFTEDGAMNLRRIYSRPPSEWPAPAVEPGVSWQELGPVLPGPLSGKEDSLQDMITLGKTLFFDTRLSSSGKISCATCHQPEKSWTDGKKVSEGHEGALNKRNAPTIQNSWFYERLFWDGRARDLQDQAFAPINSESEMHSEMPELTGKLRKSAGYRELFRKAFGDEGIDPDRLTQAIAVFEMTVTGAESRFDQFLQGDKKALSTKELRGLHLFRTRAGCMNCHNGPMFTDNQFHQTIFSAGDDGLYKVTHREEDKGKIKTPSLRDVANTGPWMHSGAEVSLLSIISTYNEYAPVPGRKVAIRLNLSTKEKTDLLAFLQAISAAPRPFTPPVLPD